MASLYEGFQSRASTIETTDPVTGEKISFALDVSLTIDTSLTAEVTKFPIEGRANITDHIQPSPLRLNLQCMLSESPSQQLLTIAGTLASAAISQVVPAGITKKFAQAAASAAVFAAGSQIGKASYDTKTANLKALLATRSANDRDYPKRAMLGLIKMFQSGALFTLHTFFGKNLYTDMVMTSINFNQTPRDGDSLFFSMSCEQVRTTSAFSQETKLELKAANPAGGSLSQVDSKGKVTPKEVEKPASGLFKITKPLR